MVPKCWLVGLQHIIHLVRSVLLKIVFNTDTLRVADVYLCFHSSQKLPQIEENLHNLVTDDFSVVEAALQEFADVVTPDNMSVLRRFALLYVY